MAFFPQIKTIPSILSGLAGGVLFFFFAAVLEAALPIAGLVALATWAGGVAMLSESQGVKRLSYNGEVQLSDDYKKALSEARNHIFALELLGKKIRKPEVVQKIVELCETAQQIFDQIEDDPEDYQRSKRFLNYYLNTTTKVIHKYYELSQHREISSEINKSLTKVESILGILDKAFKKQLSHLLENELLDLDTEVTLLENTINMESLGDDDES